MRTFKTDKDKYFYEIQMKERKRVYFLLTITSRSIKVVTGWSAHRLTAICDTMESFNQVTLPLFLNSNEETSTP